MTIGLSHFLVVSVLLLAAGILTITLKRNAIGILMGVELILNAANLNLVAFNRFGPGGSATGGPRLFDGQIFTLFVIVLAAAEAAVALAIFLNFYNNTQSIDVERAKELKG
jgi:NADH-quinone oxidoreductase subunit K